MRPERNLRFSAMFSFFFVKYEEAVLFPPTMVTRIFNLCHGRRACSSEMDVGSNSDLVKFASGPSEYAVFSFFALFWELQRTSFTIYKWPSARVVSCLVLI